MQETSGPDQLRLDKWLWYARFFKTRSIATALCKAKKVRVNGVLVSKASQTVKPTDILTFPQANRVVTVKVVALGIRRGPAPEAQALYEDLTPPPEQKPQEPEVLTREKGAGRPTKAERRAIEKLMGR